MRAPAHCGAGILRGGPLHQPAAVSGLCPVPGGSRPAPGAGVGHRGRVLRHPAGVSGGAAAADGGGAVHGPVRHLRQHGHRGHAGPAGGRAADPPGLLRHRHRRADDVRVHQPHPDHPVPAYGAHGTAQRGDPAGHGGTPGRTHPGDCPHHPADRGIRPRHFLVFPAETA